MMEGTGRSGRGRRGTMAGQGRVGTARPAAWGREKGAESRPRARCHEFRLFLFLFFYLCLRG
jgi:hypothetical protein